MKSGEQFEVSQNVYLSQQTCTGCLVDLEDLENLEFEMDLENLEMTWNFGKKY